ncbi:Down syndrome cell adhesion molecule-like protein Dscam2 [Limulus polyphemus]|uniref:Down syndrome cell adhesion molecule-like protein Dscam2 n=1 Tax=Limulus polyphemus TaxID=6850 RepID=A0ABM1RXG4_LIMPO|nr:Down syndrome cell adhesion molecule-like protein Dscam2 [Limulus polyphemus]
MGYYVGYRRRDHEKTFSYKTVAATMETDYHCDITQLDRSTVYDVIVQAFNDKGSGPATDVKSVETLKHDPPDPPILRVVTSTTTSVYLNWEQKETDTSIQLYILYRSTEHDWEEIRLPGNKKSYTFHDLHCGTRYQFYIVAHNSAGKGTPSDVISAKTYGTAPQAPEKHSLLSVNATYIVIHLTAWWSGGCPILHFIIQYKQRESQEWVLLSNSILLNQKSISITDLLPATWYTLLMTATNEAGSTEAEYVLATLTSTGGNGLTNSSFFSWSLSLRP